MEIAAHWNICIALNAFLRANVYLAGPIHALFLLKTDFKFTACIREGGLARLLRSRLEQPGELTSYRQAPSKPDEYS